MRFWFVVVFGQITRLQQKDDLATSLCIVTIAQKLAPIIGTCRARAQLFARQDRLDLWPFAQLGRRKCSHLIVVTSLDESQREPYAFALQGVKVIHKPRLVAELPAALAACLPPGQVPS